MTTIHTHLIISDAELTARGRMDLSGVPLAIFTKCVLPSGTTRYTVQDARDGRFFDVLSHNVGLLLTKAGITKIAEIAEIARVGAAPAPKPVERFLPYASHIEQFIAVTVITDALAFGLAVTVNDGEEIVLKRSSDLAAILKAMNTTDEDVLSFHEDNGRRVGFVHLIWGNGADLISNSTDNAAITTILEGAERAAEILAGL